MDIEQELYNAAAAFIESRYPFGWGGAAALRTESGEILLSTCPETKNDALSLCMEVGSILEAHKRNEKITHSICISRDSEKEQFVILTPCGICQERLVHWGGNVKVAISSKENNLQFKSLRELMPHHWSIVNGQEL